MWIITRDLINDSKDSREGRTSRGFDAEKFAAAEKIPFRLLDDDDVPYLEGEIERRDIEEGDDLTAFNALDTFMNDLGVTQMEYGDAYGEKDGPVWKPFADGDA